MFHEQGVLWPKQQEYSFFTLWVGWSAWDRTNQASLQSWTLRTCHRSTSLSKRLTMDFLCHLRRCFLDSHSVQQMAQYSSMRERHLIMVIPPFLASRRIARCTNIKYRMCLG